MTTHSASPTAGSKLTAVLGIVALMVLSGSACSKSTPDAPPASEPRTFTQAEFASLRWLEGFWLGTGNGTSPFYEGYRFRDDSTLVSFTYSDSTFATAADSGTIYLRGGVVVDQGDKASWVATAFDTTSIRFSPREGARNSFLWEHESDDKWRATLESPPPEGDGSVRRTVYQMVRRPAPTEP